MIKIYKTEESIVNEIEKVEDGCWINMVTPTMEECINISEPVSYTHLTLPTTPYV